MRVAVVTRTTERRGGIETYVEMMLDGLVQRGHALLLFCEEPAAVGVPVIDVPSSVVRCSPGQRAGAVADGLRQWAPDVVFTQGLFSPEIEGECVSVAPAVFMAHAYHGTCVSGRKMFLLPQSRPCHRRFGVACLLLYLPRRCGGLSPVTMMVEFQRQSARLDVVRRCAAVVTLSEYMRDEYVSHDVAASRVTTLPQWLPDHGPVLPHASGADDPTAPLRLAFIGRLQQEKGVHLALAALPIVRQAVGRPVRFSIAGQGPFDRRLASQASMLSRQDAGIDVRFLGHVDAEVRQRLLADTDVLVFPSIWPEPFGLVGLEAAAQGVPVAAFRVGGVPEWLADGVMGALADADPPSAQGLADAILRCAADPEARARVSIGVQAMGHAGASRHLDALERVLAAAVHQVPGDPVP